jgi:aryl-alcohol dehydrogenase-like predicted oxidoreductase
MNSPIPPSPFTHTELPGTGKRVLRMGIASNYGIKPADAFHAAERGANLWLWTPRYKSATPVIRSVVAREREQHTVVMLGTAYTAGMVRRSVEKALRSLGLEQLDYYLLSWLGRGSAFTQGVQDELLRLRQEGKIAVIGASIHDRPRAGRLAADSILDAFMLRYNAKHPGAERDVFPHTGARNPTIFAYTATSWRQLITPIDGLGEPLTPGQCYRFCLSSPHVHAVWTGPKDRDQLDANLDALALGPLGEEELARVRAYGAEVKARKKIPYL